MSLNPVRFNPEPSHRIGTPQSRHRHVSAVRHRILYASRNLHFVIHVKGIMGDFCILSYANDANLRMYVRILIRTFDPCPNGPSVGLTVKFYIARGIILLLSLPSSSDSMIWAQTKRPASVRTVVPQRIATQSA